MKKILYATVLGAFVAAGLSMCKPADAAAGQQYVSVRDGEFYIGDSVYRYVGANFWYGAILASEGRGGDRARLARELDLLQSIGVDNLRVLVGGDGEENVPSHIMPVLQTSRYSLS